MAKKKADEGLQYMLSLGFNPAKNMSGVEEQLEKASDKQTARDFMLTIDKRIKSGCSDNDTFYPLKNKNLQFSLALSSAYDADIIRKACNWISKNKELFGGTILEVGCDCGVMSCFLAKTFPDSQITAIDRCQKGIDNAVLLAEKLDVHNVQFKCADLNDVNGLYDTVFSMRTVHENHTDRGSEDLLNELDEQATVFQKSLHSYAETLSMKLSENGLLISIERMGRNALLLGWMKALEEAGLTFALNQYEELICKELGEDSVFEAFVSYKANKGTASARELFMSACTKYMDFSRAEYGGWDAKIVFDWKHGELIEGYIEEDTRTHARLKLSMWTHKYDETGLIMYENNNGAVRAAFYDISQKEEMRSALRSSIDAARQYSYIKISKM